MNDLNLGNIGQPVVRLPSVRYERYSAHGRSENYYELTSKMGIDEQEGFTVEINAHANGALVSHSPANKAGSDRRL